MSRNRDVLVHPSGSAVPDTIHTSPIWEGEGHHPDLTKTEAGCHVWRGSTYEPCFKHGTQGCCLVAHMSPAAQRAYHQPKCVSCGRFLPSRDPYADNCGRWGCDD